MGGVAASVRQIAFPLACSLVLGSTVEAQVAIQVKSGTTWTSNIELSALAPITFRWRWDGADAPTQVAWQFATVTPTSTVSSRPTDVIAGETPMKLPAPGAGIGAYQEFIVNPASNWPARFYVRVRVLTGRTSVYSRWIPVTVVSTTQRTSVDNPDPPPVRLEVLAGGWRTEAVVSTGLKLGFRWKRNRSWAPRAATIQIAKQPLSTNVRTASDAFFSETALKLSEAPADWEYFDIDYVKGRGSQFYVRLRFDGVKIEYSNWVRVYWVLPG